MFLLIQDTTQCVGFVFQFQVHSCFYNIHNYPILFLLSILSFSMCSKPIKLSSRNCRLNSAVSCVQWHFIFLLLLISSPVSARIISAGWRSKTIQPSIQVMVVAWRPSHLEKEVFPLVLGSSIASSVEPGPPAQGPGLGQPLPGSAYLPQGSHLL